MREYPYLDQQMKQQVEQDIMKGGALRVIYRDEVIYDNVFGYADAEERIPMGPDTIFRLYSMTKPITAAALMILYDRGQVDLYDPVSRYLPGFRNQKVWRNGILEPVVREATILDLLTMTSGLVYPGQESGPGEIMQELFDAFYAGVEQGKAFSTYEMCNRIGEQPLICQPGECWHYGTSADIVAGVIEVITGKRYGDYLKEEIFNPLGMVDTDFWVPAEKRARFAKKYIRNAEGNLVPCDIQHLGVAYQYEKRPEFEIGGAGLVSTMEDYSRFAGMLLHEGSYCGRHILSKHAVRFMRTDHLIPEQAKTYDWESVRGYGYGCLMRVLKNVTGADAGYPGEFGWDGWTGNHFLIDPANRLIMIYLKQVAEGVDQRPIHLMKQIIYGTMLD